MSRSAVHRRAIPVLLAAFLAGGILTGCGTTVQAAIDDLQGPLTRVDETGQQAVSDTGNTRFEDLRVGDCLNDADVGVDVVVASIDVVDCGEPHDSEFYGTATLADGPFPTDVQMRAAADELCLDLFEEYVGLRYRSSSLDFTYYTPTRLGWGDGDHEITCVLYDYHERKLVGSSRNAGV